MFSFLIILIVVGPILLVLYDKDNFDKEKIISKNFIYTLLAICIVFGQFAKDPNFGDAFVNLSATIGCVLVFESIALWIVGFQMLKPRKSVLDETTDNLVIVEIGNLAIYIPPQKYNGEPKIINEADITVVCGENILRSGVDYRIKTNGYTNNTEKGKAFLTLTGYGVYEGEYSVPFIIE